MCNALLSRFLQWLSQKIAHVLVKALGMLEGTNTGVGLSIPESEPALASGYKKVHALLVSWAGCDPRMNTELEKLKEVLDAFYNFEVETFQIPHGTGIRSHHAMNEKLLELTKRYSHHGNLLIVYYAGHGMVDPARKSVWTCSQDSNSPQVAWSALQYVLTRDTESDILIFLDCCHAGSSIAPYQTRPAGIVEVLGACGFDSTTPLYGENCFTHNLAAQLEDDCEKHQRTEELWTNLYARLNNYAPKEGNQKRASAVRYCLVGVTSDHAIRLGRLPRSFIKNFIPGARKKPKISLPKPALMCSANPDLATQTRGNNQTEGHSACDTSLQDVLRSLDYRDSSMRYENISNAHYRTFQWIFEYGHPSGFAEWLSDGNGLYWISGKAGSGKSTLMKMIASDPRTRELLSKWGVNRQVFTAVHCFWNSGSRSMRSLEGFFRSVICQVLTQWPEMVKPFQERFAEEMVLGAGPWGLQTLRSAFEFLENRTGDHNRICLFIDGLDECDECDDARIDIAHLVLELAAWGSMKICASSRPWAVFASRFQRSPSLCLQDLTYLDIRQYVEAELFGNSYFMNIFHQNPQAAKDIIADVVHQSEGVFIWVYLVVRDLRYGLRDQDHIQDLRSRINMLPTDLEAMYCHILKQISLVNRQKAARIFQLLQAAQSRVFAAQSRVFAAMEESYEPIITDIGIVVAEQVYFDTEMAIKQQCIPWTNDEISSMEDLCRKLSQDVTGGLLIIEDRTLDNTNCQKRQHGRLVAYSHQTARMFIEESPLGRAFLEEQISDFDRFTLLLESIIIQLKRLDLGTEYDLEEGVYHLPCWSLVEQGMRMACKVDQSNVQKMVKLLLSLDQTMEKQITRWSNGKFEGHWSRVLPLGKPRPPDSNDDFLSFAISYRVFEYVKASINQDKVESKLGRTYLDCALFSDFGLSADRDMVQLLQSYGASPHPL